LCIKKTRKKYRTTNDAAGTWKSAARVNADAPNSNAFFFPYNNSNGWIRVVVVDGWIAGINVEAAARARAAVLVVLLIAVAQ
jgi:hypothetical protein